MSKIALFMVINHYLEGDGAKENCAIVTKLSKKHLSKSSVLIDILAQSVLKNDSGIEDHEKLLDHYFARYKEPIADSIATLVMKAEQYPYIAKQLGKYIDAENNSHGY